MNKKSILMAIKYTIYVLLLLGVLFLCATILWVWISPYTIHQFKIVLREILKNAGSYSVLLVGVVITTFLQIYSKEKEIEKEDRVKIGEVGYYTLAFKRKGDTYSEEYNGDKIVVEINEENDFRLDVYKENDGYFHFMTKFLTSKLQTTNLKNVMAFSGNYFESNKKYILDNYYSYCERITYCSPLYCSAKPTNELENNTEADQNRYFWLILKCNDKNCIKTFWISAITEEGILLFIKVKARIQKEKDIAKISLLQQTTYYESQNMLCMLYK